VAHGLVPSFAFSSRLLLLDLADQLPLNLVAEFLAASELRLQGLFLCHFGTF
jgi:hypothetical protein